MRNDILLKQCREVDAAVGHLLDIGVEVVSVHIGPTHDLPIIRVLPGEHTRQLARLGTVRTIGGEIHISQRYYKLAWSAVSAMSVDSPCHSKESAS